MKRKIIGTTIRRILVIFVVIVISFSILPLHSSFSQNIELPKGWSFSNEYQKVPVTLKGVTYYAYEIEKTENNTRTVGWLIVDSNNKTVTDKDTYEKLALAPTVTKWIQKLNELKRMEDEEKTLSDIKWRLDLYEMEIPILKSLLSSIDTIKSNKTLSKEVVEDYIISQIPFFPVTGTELSDNFLEDFSMFVTNNVNAVLVSSGELTTNLSEFQKASLVGKAFGVMKIVIRKGAYSSFKKGFDQFEQALTLIRAHNGAWSYEDASLFLKNYEEGEARAIAYGSWYLKLVPSSVWEGLWNNVFKQVLTDLISEPSDFGTNFIKWFPETVKTGYPEVLGYNKVIEDIKSISSGFTLYKWFYDTSIKDSMAGKTYSAATASLTGTLSMTSTPSGAKVYINGSYKGLTPMTITMSQGNYTIELTKDGYSGYKINVNVTQNKVSQIKVTLTAIPKKSILHVYTNPIDANIYINGKYIGKSPLYFYQINVGTYNILIKKEGYVDYLGEVKIIANKENIINIVLTPRP